jgi:hypothetical protein
LWLVLPEPADPCEPDWEPVEDPDCDADEDRPLAPAPVDADVLRDPPLPVCVPVPCEEAPLPEPPAWTPLPCTDPLPVPVLPVPA